MSRSGFHFAASTMVGLKSVPPHPLEREPPQNLYAFTSGKIIDLMDIGVTDDQAKQRLGLFEHGCDLSCETSEKAFVNRAGSVHGGRDAPRSSGSRGILERQIDTLAFSEVAFQREPAPRGT